MYEMSPFLVTYELPKHGKTTTKRWNSLDTIEKAWAVLERERPRHIATADWRIYRDVTAIARQLKEDFPDDVLKPEGWLWLRIWHPGEYGADYWSEGMFDNLNDVRVSILEEEALDRDSVTAVYACIHHEAPPPEEPPELVREVTADEAMLRACDALRGGYIVDVQMAMSSITGVVVQCRRQIFDVKLAEGAFVVSRFYSEVRSIKTNLDPAEVKL